MSGSSWRDWRTLLFGLLVLAVLTGPFCLTAAALPPDGDHGWYWQMPQPPGGGSNALIDIAVPTSSQLWAVGGGGTIVHSADGGLTWNTQASGTGAWLSSVSFADDQHGWASGSFNTWTDDGPSILLATADGGGRWSNVPVPLLRPREGIVNVCFVDPQHGWLSTSSGTVVRTRDGGSTWTRSRVGDMTKAVRIDFVDRWHGWAAGIRGAIWRTGDGGATWIRGRTGLSRQDLVIDVDFVDRMHGWATSWRSATLTGSRSVVIRTDDGGRTWQRVMTSVADDCFALRAGSGHSAWVLSTSSGYGVPRALREMDWVFGLPEAVVVHHTSNAGRSWSDQSIHSTCYPVALAASGHAVFGVGNGIMASSDDGRHWEARTAGLGYSFTAAQALSATDIWATDRSGALLHSSDGLRWVEQPASRRWSASFSGVSFPDRNHGWVVGGKVVGDEEWGLILATSDGGANWTEQTSNLAGPLNDVDFVNNREGWATSAESDFFGEGEGASTAIEHTPDGGVTWVPQYVATEAAVYCVDFISPTLGWAGGDYSKREGDDSRQVPAVFKSTNGGMTWTRFPLPAGAPDPSDIAFLDENSGWAVGTAWNDDYSTEGWLMRTVNGGQTWGRFPGVGGTDLEAVHFVDAQHGWAAGDGVWATTDGGESWNRVAAGDGLLSVTAADAEHAWGLGDGALVSTLQTADDVAAPVTRDDAGMRWHRRPFVITLKANDIGGAGVARTEYSLDSGVTWHEGSSIPFAAPGTHQDDGVRLVLYRSTDTAGNREPEALTTALIDTLGPSCAIPKASVVNSGEQGILYFMARDANSGVAQAVITIRDRDGRVLQTLTSRPGHWGTNRTPEYYWLRFTCRLKPGVYFMEVRATDRAGNHQLRAAHRRLRVVRTGAPDAIGPDWPEGVAEVVESVAGDSRTRLRIDSPASVIDRLVWRVSRDVN